VKGSLGSVVDCCDGAEVDPFRDAVKIWAVIDPKNIDEQANIIVLCDDGGWNLDCLVVGDSTVLFLYCLVLLCCHIWTVYL
jgi:hypothetical protein